MVECAESTLPKILDQLLFAIHTAMPARVESYDPILNTVTVQPCLKRKLVGQDPINLPLIEDVPVMFPGSGDYWMTFEIVKDSYVLLVFSERSIEQWLIQGGIVDPANTRRFSLSDAIAIPGLIPTPDILIPPIEAGICIRKKDGTEYLKMASGKIEVLIPEFEITGNLKVIGNISGLEVTADVVPPIALSSHAHDFTTPSGPVLGPIPFVP